MLLKSVSVRFGLVTSEFTTLECVQQASIITGVSLATFARVHGTVMLGNAAISRQVCFTTIR